MLFGNDSVKFIASPFICLLVYKKDILYTSDAGTEGARGATAPPPPPPIIDRSVNPIPTGGGQTNPTYFPGPPPQSFSSSGITALRLHYRCNFLFQRHTAPL